MFDGHTREQQAARISAGDLQTMLADDDNVAPIAQGLAIVDALPSAVLWRTHGFGHSGALRDPATIAQVVSFLTTR